MIEAGTFLHSDFDVPARHGAISSDELAHDLELLAVALNAAHPAQWVVAEPEWHRVVSTLGELKTCTDVGDFAVRLSRHLLQIPDGHLEVNFDNQRIGLSPRPVSTGVNLAAKGRPWVLEWRGKIPVLAIGWFPQPSDKEWDGFLDAVRVLRGCKNAVVDLRGNPGGNDYWTIEGTSILLDREVPVDWVSEVFCESAIGAALQANTYSKIMWARYFQRGLPAPDALVEMRDQQIARSQSLPSAPVKREVFPPPPPASQLAPGPDAFDGKLYVLLDALSRSSAEWTALYLKQVPGCLWVGEPSFGKIHFGNSGLLYLPHSRVEVVLCEKINRLTDGRFFEKTGLIPDHAFSGGDSLEYTVTQLIGL